MEQRMGIGGRPVGRRVHGRKPKMSTPCSDFQNTQNKEDEMNGERCMNKDTPLNRENKPVFQSSDDILEILRSHPDFARVTPDRAGAIAAAILSAVVAGGGIVILFSLSGGSAVASAPLLIKALGSGLLTAGASGIPTALSMAARLLLWLQFRPPICRGP
jgi:hypothetical protein